MVGKRLCQVHVRFDWSVFSACLTLVKEGYLNSVSMVWCFYCFVRKMGVKCFFSWHFVRFFFFVTSSPTLLLMINRESFNRHQDWLERRPGQSQAQMRKKEGWAQGCRPLPKQGNRWRNFVLREKLFSLKTDEVGTTYPQGKKKRSGPKHTWQRDLQADKPLGHSSKWPLLRKKQERLQCSRTG